MTNPMKPNVLRAANAIRKMKDPDKRGYAFRYLYHVVTNTRNTQTSFRHQRGWTRPPDPPDSLIDGAQGAKIRRLITGKLGV